MNKSIKKIFNILFIVIISILILYILMLLGIYIYDKINSDIVCNKLADGSTFCYDKKLVEENPE